MHGGGGGGGGVAIESSDCLCFSHGPDLGHGVPVPPCCDCCSLSLLSSHSPSRPRLRHSTTLPCLCARLDSFSLRRVSSCARRARCDTTYTRSPESSWQRSTLQSCSNKTDIGNTRHDNFRRLSEKKRDQNVVRGRPVRKRSRALACHDRFVVNRFRAHAANVRAVFAHGTAIRQEQQVRVVFDEVVTLCATTGKKGTVVSQDLPLRNRDRRSDDSQAGKLTGSDRRETWVSKFDCDASFDWSAHQSTLSRVREKARDDQYLRKKRKESETTHWNKYFPKLTTVLS